MIFLDNKYTKIYYKIINNSISRNHIKIKHDNFQLHHIIPRCAEGTNYKDNLVYLSYKEHKLCHHLLIYMCEGEIKNKLRYAYKFFDSKYPTPSPQIYCTADSYTKMAETRKRNGTYKYGKDNIFSSPEIIAIVKHRMITDNPMKSEKQKERMRLENNNPLVKKIKINDVVYNSLNEAARILHTTPYFIKKNYLLEDIS